MLNHFSHVQLWATLWTIARQPPLSMGFSSQEYWSGLPWPSPGDLPDSGVKSRSPALQVDSLQLNHLGSPRILEWVAMPFPRGSSRLRDLSNPGLLHCRGILYQLSYQRSPLNIRVIYVEYTIQFL